MSEGRKALLWVQENLKKLLLERPYLIHKIRQRGGAALLVLEYWRKYYGLEFRLKDWDQPLMNPETILREARNLRLTKETITKESLKPFIRSGIHVDEDQKQAQEAQQ